MFIINKKFYTVTLSYATTTHTQLHLRATKYTASLSIYEGQHKELQFHTPTRDQYS